VNDVEELLRQTLTDRAQSAPQIRPLSAYLATEPRSRRSWWRWGALAAVSVGAAATVAGFVFLGSLSPDDGVDTLVLPGTSVSPTGSDQLTLGGVPLPLTTSSWQPGDAADLAAISGSFGLDGQGCLVGLGVGEPLIWPAGFTAQIGGDGLVRVMNPEGTIVAVSGQTMTAAGAATLTHGQTWSNGTCTQAYREAFVIQDSLVPPPARLVTTRQARGSGCQDVQVATTGGNAADWSQGTPHIDMHVGETLSLISAGRCASLSMSGPTSGVLAPTGRGSITALRATATGSERVQVIHAMCEAMADPSCNGGVALDGSVIVRVS